MFPKPRADLVFNTAEFERLPLIRPTGFREYDARWLFPDDINLMGFQALGLGLGTLLHQSGIAPQIIVAHDYRSYSSSVKHALINGLMASGMHVHDIGLGITPMAYFAQFNLDIAAVAMVTASHNDNGWTGVKMGMDKPLTFGPDEMSALKDIVLNARFDMRGGGDYTLIPDMVERYIADLLDRPKLNNRIKIVAACGNGTAGVFAEEVLRGIGAEVIAMDCNLDHSFPRYNPNPEDMAMLEAMAEKISETGAAIGLGFDGDGDRCGVVDNEGEEIFADKVGVMLARDISSRFADAQFVVDVKSTGLFETDPVLRKNGARTNYWKTGHSYIKRQTHKLGAIAGFEKSGHYFFNPPIGRGYDDGFVSALAILDMLDHNPGKSMADLKRELPKTWGSPTMSPSCADEEKYAVAERGVVHFTAMKERGEKIAGQNIKELNTVNGIRIVLDDGTWGLLRASSNTPQLVVVVESPTSEANKIAMFRAIDAWVEKQPEIGEYNQKL